MGLMRRWRKRIRTLLRGDVVERELDQELGFHLRMEAERNRRSAMGPEEARRSALIAFGGVEQCSRREDTRLDEGDGARLSARRPDAAEVHVDDYGRLRVSGVGRS
jgi:hypothetical protein